MSDLKPFTTVENRMLEAPEPSEADKLLFETGGLNPNDFIGEDWDAEMEAMSGFAETIAFLLFIFSIIGFLTVLVGGLYIIIRIVSLII